MFGAVRTRQFDFMHSLAVVGITIFMPEILAEVGSGTESCFLTFMIYSVQQVTNMPATLIAYKLLDTRLGRRLSIVIFTTASGVFMFSFLLVKDLAGVTLTQIIIVSSLCSALNFMGLSAFATMIPETYPTEVRSTGRGWILICGKIGSIMSPFITGVIISSAGVRTVVVFFAVLMAATGLLGLGMKETLGRKTL